MSRLRAAKILAKSVVKDLKRDGLSPDQIVRFASELLELASNDPAPVVDIAPLKEKRVKNDAAPASVRAPLESRHES